MAGSVASESKAGLVVLRVERFDSRQKADAAFTGGVEVEVGGFFDSLIE